MCKILTHNIWDTVENSVIEVRKATMKARMLTGTYILQVHKNKFNQAEIVDDNFPFFLFVSTIHYGTEFRKLVHVQDIDNLCKKSIF
jgi:hypothetical protein